MVKELQISAALFVKSTSSAGLQNSGVPESFLLDNFSFEKFVFFAELQKILNFQIFMQIS